MANHEIIWAGPAPFWSEATTSSSPGDRARFLKPAILRFSNDEFMEEFMNVLATDPLRLGEYRIQPETWRGMASAAAEPIKPAKAFALPWQRLGITRGRVNGALSLPTLPPPSQAPAQTPLKLYQPAHQRYYLLSACLVCQTAALPDRKVDAGKQERVGFVIRRLLPPNDDTALPLEQWEEYAWMAATSGNVWQKIDPDKTRMTPDGEEQLPLFAVNFTSDDQRRRRLFAGVVPVGRREAYLAAATGTQDSTPGETAKTARKILLRTDVIEPWKSLVDRASGIRATWTIAASPPSDDRIPSDPEKAAQVNKEREQIQTASWYVLLDFAKFLERYLPSIWRVITGLAGSASLNSAEAAVWARLGSISVGAALTTSLKAGSTIGTVASSLADALRRIVGFEPQLENVTAAYGRGTSPASEGWPSFLFPLADPELPNGAPLPPPIALGTLSQEETLDLAGDPAPGDNDPAELLDDFAVLLVRALPEDTTAAQPAVPAAATAPKDIRDGWFVMRCVYARPACGPLHDDAVSEPTDRFQLAGFFDPDAPARPIRIGLPVDTTPAGLRKFNKNTAFVMSDVLCGQVKRLKGITLGDLIRSVLPWPLHKDLSVPDGGPCVSNTGGSLGTICSISIPIITICALIVLMIMVALLDIIFRWMPFFMICFPIPGLKAKK